MLLPECSEACYTELIPLILSGLGYALFAGVTWAIIPSVTDPKLMGTAFGIACSFLNIGLAVIPTLGGYIHDQTTHKMHGFFWVKLNDLLTSLISNLFFG